jgi:2,3-bisphosphoglycerate-independent phosphoglycerate mutase
MKITPALLIILDGFGHREACADNAICQARKPHWNFLWQTCPHTLIQASEKWVGLPAGQMGNSEVGHMNIGAGRVVYQDYTKIEHAIETGEFGKNPVIQAALQPGRQHAVHILGLLSPGGVHSHESQIAAVVRLAAERNTAKVYVHAFLDGRDTPPQSAAASITTLDQLCKSLGNAQIASICGRFYAMDRDQRWPRIQTAYDLITDGHATHHARDALSALEAAYARGETDEFVTATAIHTTTEPINMADGDTAIFMNFRSDRARQLTSALTDPRFQGFTRARQPQLSYFCTLTSYGDEFSHIPAAFGPQHIDDGLGEYLSKLGLKQLRIAETEKFAHVTYFFNGGVEQPYTNETRILVPSPKVATYDLEPAMSARVVTDQLIAAIESRQFDALICNFANGDMVGHTGNLAAATAAIEVLDECIGRLTTAIQAIGGELLITADHGNAETMHDPESNQPHTAHTLNPVPVVYLGRQARLRDDGSLQDIAPTLLAMMGVAQPAAMTGQSLIEFA